MQHFNRICGFIISAVMFWACGTTSNQATEELSESIIKRDIQAICLGNNVAVRETPSTTGDRLTVISIGESVMYLDSTVVDTDSKGNYEYALIQLSDGTLGWVVKRYLFEDSDLYTAKEATTIYSRPDLLTSTNKSFQAMDLLVTPLEQSQVNGEWLKVTGRIQGTKSFTSGWIKRDNTTGEQPDVLVAQLVYKANELKGEKRMNELTQILNEDSYAGSAFLNSIRALTYNDPNGFLKKEFEQYYVGMINYYDSAGHQYYYRFTEEGPSVEIFGKTFYAYKSSEICDYCEYHFIWYLFYDLTTYLADVKGYEGSGHNGNYFEIKDKLSAMGDLAGVPVYNKWTEEYTYRDFNRVNSEFVSWVSSNMIPHPENEFLGMSAQQVYDVVFRRNARDTWSQWRLMEYQFDLEQLASDYAEGMEYEDFDGYDFVRNNFRDTNVNPILAGIFIRRVMDNSYDEIIHAMKKVMALYDNDWITEQLTYEPYGAFEDYDEGEVNEQEYDEEGSD